ncbi:MAG: hypothetical protein M1819_003347 [Sarea resinae]|nr:MAG: hypothetical protein M1819_003347 [Sarea resinae]
MSSQMEQHASEQPIALPTDFDYRQPSLERIEGMENYVRGGYHPVLIGDLFRDGRYKVIHKLGHGAFATVWLARDTHAQRYVSLKILTAEVSEEEECCDVKVLDFLSQRSSSHPGRQYICFLFDHFWIQGPNGSHLCLVSEVLGPTIEQLLQLQKRLRGRVAQDLTAANVAFELANFDHYTEEEVHLRLGSPKTELVTTASGNALSPSAPRYVVQPATFSNVGSEWLKENIRLLDFGIAFFESSPPEFLGTPPGFMAPEGWFESKYGQGTDLWAVGCTIFTIRSGQPVIHIMLGGNPEEVIGKIVEVLGPLPSKWDSLYFDEECYPRPREEAGDEAPPPWYEEDDETVALSLREIAEGIEDEYHGPPRPEDLVEPPKLDYELEMEAQGITFILPPRKPMAKISRNEAIAFADFMCRILRYEPSERPSADELSKHHWLSEDYPDTRTVDGAPPWFRS